MNKIIKQLALGIISALMCLGCIELSKVKAEDNYLSQFSYQTVQENNMIILTSHEGNSESVSIYSPVEIDGDEYTVAIADDVLSNNDVIKNISINGNIMLPEDLTGFFASSSYENVILDIDDTTAVTSMKDMFIGCNDLISVSFLKFNTSNVTDMSGMFDGCTSLEELGLSSFNTEKASEMDNMFGNCCNLTKVILGDQFIVWTDEAYLPDGLWVNGDNSVDEVSLYEQYPLHLETWAGTWQRRDDTEITEIILSKDEDELYVGDEEQISLAADTEEPVKTVSEETALMSNIDTNSSDVNSESSQIVRALLDTGVAYAILQANGELVFFRSENTYSNGVDYTVTDINGNNYTGTVYAGVEDAVMDVPPWSSNADSITRVLVAEGTIIKPKSMAEWFAEAMNLESFSGSGFDTSDITDMSDMFGYCSSLTALNLSSFNTGNVIDMSGMFNSCKNLTTLNLSSFDTSSVTDMSMMFDGCNSLTSINLSSFDTSNVTDMSLMFDDCSSLTSIDLSGFDTSNVTDMSDMFCYCSSLTSLDLGSFDTSNVTDMSDMFRSCSFLTSLDISSFDTSSVTTMSGMFYECGCSSLDLSGFDTVNVTNMSMMFYDSSLYSLNISNFDTGNVTNMGWMFSGCSSLETVNISSFSTSNVTDMGWMFMDCSSLTTLDLSSFDTSKVSKMTNMFYNCSSLSSVKLGKRFTRWSNNAYLPEGTWTNGSITKTETELYNEYPSHASEWAGTWTLKGKTPVNYVGTSLDLDGIINMNFYFKVPEEYEGAYAVLKDEMGNRTEVDLSTVPYSDKNGYKVTYPNIVAKRMMMKIELTVCDKDGNVIPMERKGSLLPNGTFSYCVTDYVNDVLMTSSRAYSKDLAYAILNYGQCAQEYFGYETDKPMPNPLGYLASEMAEVEADPQYTQTGPEWDQYIGASLDLEGAISSYLYFRVPITATMVKSNGEESALPVVQNANGYRVEIRNIAAKRLHEMYTIRVKYEGNTYEYRTGVFSYVNRVLIPKPEANKSNLGKAFYLYNKAARLYFGY